MFQTVPLEVMRVGGALRSCFNNGGSPLRPVAEGVSDHFLAALLKCL